MAHSDLTLPLLLSLALAGPAWPAAPQKRTAGTAPRSAEPAAAPEPRPMLEIPRGAILAVDLVDPLDSGKNKPGEAFRARVSEGVWVQGRVALPPGTVVRGSVTEAVPSGRVKGRARLSITLRAVDLDGRTYEVETDTLSYQGNPHTGGNIASWLGGAMQGALYGVLFGGKDGAIIGAGAGAAAGGAAAVLKGKLDVQFPQGSKLMFETQSPFQVPEPPPALPVTSPVEQSTSPAKPKPAS